MSISSAEPVPWGLDVIRLRASKDSPTAEEHVTWTLEFDISADEQETGRRAVIGTLHAGGPGGWGDITVAALYSATGDLEGDELAAKIKLSDASEALYDFGRSHLTGLLATVGAEVTIPRSSPEPTMAAFDSNEEVSDDDGPKSPVEANEPA